MAMMTEGICDGCQRRALLMPLHGPDKGGPLRCFVCAGQWQAQHGRRRKMGRVVIRAIRAYVDGGGSWDDVRKLKDTALMGGDTFGIRDAWGSVVDPLGYMAETAETANETVLLTSEVLADALRLVHPDVHPLERRELANRVTQQLLTLQPFVFPAIKPKPIVSSDVDEASCVTPLRQSHLRSSVEPLRRYPCADCASTIPYFYCTTCRAEYDRRHREELAAINVKRKARRVAKKEARQRPCSACGKVFRGKRKDARYCSAACRQRAHRKASEGMDKRRERQSTKLPRDVTCPPL
jgi:hypothetical protein